MRGIKSTPPQFLFRMTPTHPHYTRVELFKLPSATNYGRAIRHFHWRLTTREIKFKFAFHWNSLSLCACEVKRRRGRTVMLPLSLCLSQTPSWLPHGPDYVTSGAVLPIAFSGHVCSWAIVLGIINRTEPQMEVLPLGLLRLLWPPGHSKGFNVFYTNLPIALKLVVDRKKKVRREIEDIRNTHFFICKYSRWYRSLGTPPPPPLEQMFCRQQQHCKLMTVKELFAKKAPTLRPLV